MHDYAFLVDNIVWTQWDAALNVTSIAFGDYLLWFFERLDDSEFLFDCLLLLIIIKYYILCIGAKFLPEVTIQCAVRSLFNGYTILWGKHVLVFGYDRVLLAYGWGL